MTTPNQPREGDSQIDAMANAFLRWPLPESVCADLCATQQGKGRVGTNLLSFTEAKQMFQDIVGPLVLSGRIKQKIIDLKRTPPSQDAVGGTPRTDAAAFEVGPDSPEYSPSGLYVYASFARSLERELNAANTRVSKALLVGKTNWDNKLAAVTAERDELAKHYRTAFGHEYKNRNSGPIGL